MPIIRGGEDLVGLLVEAAEKYAGGFMDRDILVLSSKVVSIAYGYMVRISTIKPSKRALKLARKTNMDPRYVQLLLDLSDDILFVVPFKRLICEGIVPLDRMARDPVKARAAVDRIPYVFFVLRGGQIYSDAGIDYSNSPPEYVTYLPKNPDEVARKIRKEIERRTGKKVAVIISDTEVMFPFGSMNFARGSSGVGIMERNFGEEDLFGVPKFGGVDIIAHELASAAALLMGQTRERIPAVIIRGFEWRESDEGISEVFSFSRKSLKRLVKLTLRATLRVLGIRKLLEILR